MGPRYIDPLETLGPRLLTVEKPARYVGGEYGSMTGEVREKCPPPGGDAVLRTLIAFPDLYEIGMSNQAFRIIYNRLNKIPGISCDRAFAPAPDFEALLREQGLPLYGLETGISLKDLDILMFTLGYELGITGVLAMLDVSGIPLHAAERGGEDPVVIMGGPCVSNPLPYAAFIDAFWIGEAEAGFFDLAAALALLKQGGAGRAELLARISAHPSVWTRGKERAVRAIDGDFDSRPAEAAVFPVPSMKTVQLHGAVEIMRGCPNGCRFCHAGFWYRPMRQKPVDTILEEAAAFINRGGYRELSLSSLSSGDYVPIDRLVEQLNRNFSGRHISFQLPSLKVSSFSLSLLEKISETRKSGLTFAVETPEEAWQLVINKVVSRENVLAILREAKRRGWRGAKFYFMIGLPVEGADPGEGRGQGPADETGEEHRIAEFVAGLGREAGMNFHINVGIFVPKPHTPFEQVPQIRAEEARRKLNYIRSRLKPLGHKVSVPDPLISTIEGILSRGDERAGPLIQAAFQRGCRLDAWAEFCRKDLWEAELAARKDLVEEIQGGKNPLPPWRFIDPGMRPSYLAAELTRSKNEEITSPCINKCTYPCGICQNGRAVVKNNIQSGNLLRVNLPVEDPSIPESGEPEKPPPRDTAPALRFFPAGADRDPAVWRLIFSFAKEGRAVFLSHLSVMEVFSMALIRADIPVLFSGGFNPLPKLEICAPLSIGISAAGEIAAIDTQNPLAGALFVRLMNENLPAGIRVREAAVYEIPGGAKKHSLASRLWGFAYAGSGGGLDYVPAGDEKKYRARRAEAPGGSVFGLRRLSVLARTAGTPDPGQSFFSAYRDLYPPRPGA
jgi:radical SAM superfamily enzyme YgiQ (UPF0313 family)